MIPEILDLSRFRVMIVSPEARFSNTFLTRRHYKLLGNYGWRVVRVVDGAALEIMLQVLENFIFIHGGVSKWS